MPASPHRDTARSTIPEFAHEKAGQPSLEIVSTGVISSPAGGCSSGIPQAGTSAMVCPAKSALHTLIAAQHTNGSPHATAGSQSKDKHSDNNQRRRLASRD